MATPKRGRVSVSTLELRGVSTKGPSGVGGHLSRGSMGYHGGERRERRVPAHLGDGGGTLVPKQSEEVIQATGDGSPPGGLILYINM